MIIVAVFVPVGRTRMVVWGESVACVGRDKRGAHVWHVIHVTVAGRVENLRRVLKAN